MNPRRQHTIPKGPYISHISNMKVRFYEVDSMGIVWHGNYVHFFEEGREELGHHYNIDFQSFKEEGLTLPVVHFCSDYYDSLRYGQSFQVETRLFLHDHAMLETTSIIRLTPESPILAMGHAIQLFVDSYGQTLLTQPQMLRDFYQKHLAEFANNDHN